MSGLSLLAALKAFDATVHAGGVSAGARAMGLSQATVSFHIQRLERDYGVELFHRRGRRLELTPFGRTLLEHARRVCSAEDDAAALLAAAKNRYAGRLAVHAIGPYNVLPILEIFRERSPGVRVTVGVGDSRSITGRILDYQGDVGVVLDHEPHPELHGVRHRTQSLVVFAPVGHPLAGRPQVSFEELAGQPFVIREEGSTTRRVFETALARRGLRVEVALEMGSREAVREAVAQGMGLGVVAEPAYVDDPRLARLRVVDADMATHVDLICRAERRQAPLIAAFYEAAARCAASRRGGRPRASGIAPTEWRSGPI